MLSSRVPLRFTGDSRLRALSVMGLLVALICMPLVLQVPNKYGNPLLNELHESSHFLLFAVWHGIILAVLAPSPNQTDRAKLIAIVVGASAFSLLAGGAVEWVQGYIGRSSSWADMWRDLLGILFANALFVLVRVKLTRSTALLYCATVVAIAGLAFANVYPWLLAHWHRNYQFPLLLDAESPHSWRYLGEVQFAQWHIGSAPREWQNNDSAVIKVDITKPPLGSGLFPGMMLRAPFPNWQGFDQLEFDVYSPQQQTIQCGLHLYSLNAKGQRMLHYRGFVAAPGLSRITVPLSPRDNLNMQALTGILWHPYFEQQQAMTLYFDNVRLSQSNKNSQ